MEQAGPQHPVAVGDTQICLSAPAAAGRDGPDLRFPTVQPRLEAPERLGDPAGKGAGERPSLQPSACRQRGGSYARAWLQTGCIFTPQPSRSLRSGWGSPEVHTGALDFKGVTWLAVQRFRLRSPNPVLFAQLEVSLVTRRISKLDKRVVTCWCVRHAKLLQSCPTLRDPMA